MMLRLLLAIFLYGLLVDGKSVGNFNWADCERVSDSVEKWKATVSFPIPLTSINVTGGDVTYIRDDGRYMEIAGTVDGRHSVCFEIHGSFSGDNFSGGNPKVEVHITLMNSTQVVKTREIRSLRNKRAKQIWHLSSVPVTTNIKTLLAGFEPYVHQWGDDSLSGSTKHSSSGALVVFYAKGTYSQSPNKRGVGWFTTPNGLPSDADDLVLTYDIYFEDFGFGKMGKLPGLYGGVTGEGAYKCSGGNNPTSCFSLRLMWRAEGAGELYAYIPTNQEPGFNSRPDVIANSDYGQSIGRGKIKFQNGVWQTVTEQVHLNTVGKTDGWVKFCNKIEGGSQQCYTAQNLRMRNSADHHLRGLFFSTFFGGSSPDDAAPGDCRTYYKELSIAIPDSTSVG